MVDCRRQGRDGHQHSHAVQVVLVVHHPQHLQTTSIVSGFQGLLCSADPAKPVAYHCCHVQAAQGTQASSG